MRRVLALGIAALALSGCAVAALPCRVSGDIVGAVPLVGGVASAPLTACADIID
jgi:hypothetical protein